MLYLCCYTKVFHAHQKHTPHGTTIYINGIILTYTQYQIVLPPIAANNFLRKQACKQPLLQPIQWQQTSSTSIDQEH